MRSSYLITAKQLEDIEVASVSGAAAQIKEDKSHFQRIRLLRYQTTPNRVTATGSGRDNSVVILVVHIGY